MEKGNQPLTQQTRDNMAQTDHDKLVEYGVMLSNIMAGQIRLEAQIKDLIQGQASSLASWEATSKTVHDAHDSRIRKIEDFTVQYIPTITELLPRTKALEITIQGLIDSKTEVIAGWRAIVMIFGAMAGFASFIWIVSQLFFHAK
jgi:hypothetical protein